MLPRLLSRVSQGGGFSTASLAREFGVTRELMEAMLADLARAGYLRAVETCGKSQCGGCQFTAPCVPQERVWVLTRQRP